MNPAPSNQIKRTPAQITGQALGNQPTTQSGRNMLSALEFYNYFRRMGQSWSPAQPVRVHELLQKYMQYYRNRGEQEKQNNRMRMESPSARRFLESGEASAQESRQRGTEL